MPLNGEKKNRNTYARLTPDQIKIEELKRDINSSLKANEHLNNQLDKLVEQRDDINGHIRKYVTGKRSAGITLDSILNTMEWRR